jgi:RNA polymerase sigma factor (sigma-70 family)
MTQANAAGRLSQISTLWSLVHRAHQAESDAAGSARQQLFFRYEGAVRRYLRNLLRSSDAADEVFQEFALRLVHGDLHGADPERGRFRNFVKGTLFHLIADYRKRQRKWPQPLPDHGAAVLDQSEAGSDRDFLESWRDELLARAWAALAQCDARSGQPYSVVLRFRADHPELRSPQMSKELALTLARPMTAVAIRQILHRARERFADLLLDEVRRSLGDPTSEQVEQELIDLGLFDYCRPALERRATRIL